MHAAIAKEGDHIDALWDGEMEPLEGIVELGRTIRALDGMPFYPPLLEGGNPVVVVAGVFVDILVVHFL